VSATVETLAWWDPAHLAGNPAVRPELLADLDRVLDALDGDVVKVNGSLVTDGRAVPASEVKDVMLAKFPADALGWVDAASWQRATVPLDRIDFTNRGSWAAHHQPKRVDHFADRVAGGDPPNPVILVDTPGDHDYMVVDGHHRALAYRKLGQPVPAYVGVTPTRVGPWDETHSFQLSQGSSAANKTAEVEKRIWDPGRHPRGSHGRFGGGGLISHAGDFGGVGDQGTRHALHPATNPEFMHLSTPPTGTYLSAARIGPPELPHEETKRYVRQVADAHPEIFTTNTQFAVHDHKGEKRLVRTGTALALAASLSGLVGGTGGDTLGFTETPDPGPEATEMYNMFNNVTEKDDPFFIHSGTTTSAPLLIQPASFVEPSLSVSPPSAGFPGLPSVTSLSGLLGKAVSAAHSVVAYVASRPLVRLNRDWASMTADERDAFLADLVDGEEPAAAKSAETAALSETHHPLGTHGLWGSKTEQLPAYIQNVAHALIRDGHDESSAIAIAVGTMKRWAAGGGKVTPEVRAAAIKALAEWERLKAEHAGKGAGD
jgi:hypothetical protein